MDHRRRNEPEFDEFEKLLGEIPKVTSGNDYSPFPIWLGKKVATFEEQHLHLPGDRAFTSAFAEGNLNFGIPNQTPENPQLMFFPSYHSPNTSPCVYEKFDSKKLDALMFRKLPHVGYFPNAQTHHYMPSSLPDHQALDQSHINWRNIEEGQCMPMNPHLLYLCNNAAPRQEHFGYGLPEQSNINLFCNGEDSDESRVRSLDGS
ncbi:hypothetical protein Bca52824_022278 [Brassica carinata]|uniref:Uncharacterized protein n=1 Tax=Brassica carinata TaxID=52824 RepID=A0A8X7VG95_BRACI|nr:hypothetical protein Bca52824_022278 [Brassica carinata]